MKIKKQQFRFKRFFLTSLSIMVLLALVNIQPASSSSQPAADKAKQIPDVAILRLKEGFALVEDTSGAGGRRFKTGSAEVDAALKALDVQSVKSLFPAGQMHKLDASKKNGDEFTHTYLLRFKKLADIDAAVATLSALSDVEFAEHDSYMDTLGDPAPNDPRYLEQWALSAIGAPSAWAGLPADTPKIIVAVIDSGVCADHPDLAGRILNGWDFIESDAVPQDDFDHGCSVSGVIAANANNSIGIAGVAPNTQIMPLRVLDANGIGSYSDVASALVFAADNGAKVINLSLGGVNPSVTLESAVNYAISKGVIVVAAAGNNSTEGVLYPAAYPNVIAVGSVDSNLQHSSFSNYGSQIDIWAPGRDILTTKRDGSYGLASGTSLAAPYVAGAAAVDMALGVSLPQNGSLLWIVPTDLMSDMFSATPTATVNPVNTVRTETSDMEIFIDFDLVSIPNEIRSVIIEMILHSSPDIFSGASYFVVGAFQENGLWGYGTISAAVGNEPPDWKESIQFVVYKENENWKAAFEGALEYQRLMESTSMYSSEPIQSLATNFKFPWKSDQIWCYTSKWHSGWSVDFAPRYDVPSGERWFLSSGDGYLTSTCNDGYQSFIKVQNSSLGDMKYGHLDSASIPSGILNTNIHQGQKLAKAYDGTKGAGWYNIGAKWPWPSCTANSTCNWDARTGCCYLQYKTTCGAGTGDHFHWTLPTSNTTVDGWTIGTDGIWRKSGQANRDKNACFSSSNSSDAISPTTSYSVAGTIGEYSWYRSAVQVTLSATDNSGGSGVSLKQYKIDSGSWQTYSAPFYVSSEGNHTVYYKSKDVAGNWESEKSLSFKIDASAPTGSISIQNGSAETYSTTVSLNTQASDSGSGVAWVQFRDYGEIDWSQWYSYPSVVSWTLPGQNGQTVTVEAQFKDGAGNLSSVYPDSIKINLYPARPSSSLYTLQSSTLGASGMNVNSSNYVLHGTAGQPTIIGQMQSSNYKMDSGYWAVNRGLDSIPPFVESITRLNSNPTNASTVQFAVTFSKPVTGVNTSSPFSDFSLTKTGVTGGSITAVSGSGADYTVTVNTGSGNGTLRLNVVDDDSIQDGNGKKLGGTGLGNGNFTGEIYDVIKITYAISGNAGVAGATLSYTDGTPKTTTTDANGLYSFTVPSGWSGTVTPSQTGYTFSPINKTYTSIASNQTAQNYTATGITYMISGNAGVAGATLSYTDGTSKTAVADGSGNYSFAVSYNWSGTVTPTKAGYTFSPTNKNYVNVLTNQTAQDYVATAIVTVDISGNAGVTGVTLSYIDGTSKAATTDSLGYYSFNVPYNWSGTVTPSLSGYSFLPSSRIYANLQTDQADEDYLARALDSYEPDNTSAQAKTIVGGNPQSHNILPVADIDWVKFQLTAPSAVKIETSGAENADTVMYLYASGDLVNHISMNDDKDTAGENYYSYIEYSCSNLLPTGTYYVKVSEYGSDDEILDYSLSLSASQTCYTISGATGVDGTTLNYTDGISKTVTANGSGLYSFMVPSGWLGTVTPSRNDYTFSPSSKNYSSIASNQTNQDYTPILNPYIISGALGVEGAGATIDYTGGSTTADSNGDYSFRVVSGWSGTVTPYKNGYVFSPESRNYDNIIADQLTQDYQIVVSISGNVGLADVTLSYVDGTTKSVVSGANGDYSFMVPYNWMGTLIPSKIGYVFKPSNIVYSSPLTENQINQDFVAVHAYYSIAANDGWTLESSENSNVANMKSNAGLFRVGDDTKNKQYRSLLYFDTGKLPNNAVVTSAIVKIGRSGAIKGDIIPLGPLVADMKKGFYGLAPLEMIDFSALGVPLSRPLKFVEEKNSGGIGTGTYILTLTPATFKYINLLGVTQFRLRFTKDDDNDKAADYINFYADPNNPASPDQPQFIIEYYVP